MGREMALELARHGAKVVVNYANSESSANDVVARIKAMGSDAIAVKADVSRVNEIVALFNKAKSHFGKLHIVSSNSGIVSFGHLKDVTEEEYDRVMSINTRGQFFVAREAYKHLEVGGRIVLMGSITGQAKGVPRHATYSGSKGAIESFVRAMAMGKFIKHSSCPFHPFILSIESIPSDSVFLFSSTTLTFHPLPLQIQTAVTKRSRSTVSLREESRRTCTTPCAGNTSPAAHP